jgi:GGDEF domain-containing protein
MSQFGLTISVGVAEFDPDSMATMNDILRAADADMYQVKAERPRRAASR